jgi:hypothetical protein
MTDGWVAEFDRRVAAYVLSRKQGEYGEPLVHDPSRRVAITGENESGPYSDETGGDPARIDILVPVEKLDGYFGTIAVSYTIDPDDVGGFMREITSG